MGSEEEILWQGSPSQWTNFWPFVLCILVIPIPWAIWRYLATRCYTYEVTNQRIRIRQGVFSRRTDSLELFRVKDASFLQPFVMRLVGIGIVELETSDVTTPALLDPRCAGCRPAAREDPQGGGCSARPQGRARARRERPSARLKAR